MAANFSHIVWACMSEAGFRQVPLVQNFRNFHNIVVKNHLLKLSEKKAFKKKSLHCRNSIGQYLTVNLIPR